MVWSSTNTRVTTFDVFHEATRTFQVTIKWRTCGEQYSRQLIEAPWKIVQKTFNGGLNRRSSSRNYNIKSRMHFNAEVSIDWILHHFAFTCQNKLPCCICVSHHCLQLNFFTANHTELKDIILSSYLHKILQKHISQPSLSIQVSKPCSQDFGQTAGATPRVKDERLSFYTFILTFFTFISTLWCNLGWKPKINFIEKSFWNSNSHNLTKVYENTQNFKNT